MVAWVVLVLVALLAVLIIVKVVQVLFGVLAIALLVVAFFFLRDRVNEWLARR